MSSQNSPIDEDLLRNLAEKNGLATRLINVFMNTRDFGKSEFIGTQLTDKEFIQLYEKGTRKNSGGFYYVGLGKQSRNLAEKYIAQHKLENLSREGEQP